MEDGVGDLDLDAEGAAVDRKKHTHGQKTSIWTTNTEEKLCCF